MLIPLGLLGHFLWLATDCSRRRLSNDPAARRTRRRTAAPDKFAGLMNRNWNRSLAHGCGPLGYPLLLGRRGSAGWWGCLNSLQANGPITAVNPQNWKTCQASINPPVGFSSGGNGASEQGCGGPCWIHMAEQMTAHAPF